MNFSCIAEDEMRAMYRDAADKKNMIVVLSELTLSTHDEVMEFLGVERPTKRKRPKRRGSVDRERAMQLWKKGLCDGAIAKELCVCRSGVQRWRSGAGLPPNLLPRPAGKVERVRSRILELYKQGLDDVEIGKLTELHPNSVGRWRKENGLPPNGTRGGDRRRKKGKKTDES